MGHASLLLCCSCKASDANICASESIAETFIPLRVDETGEYVLPENYTELRLHVVKRAEVEGVH